MEFLNVGGQQWEELALRKDVIHMGHNCNTLPLDPAIHDAMIRSIQEDAYRVYTPPEGFAELRMLIAEDIGVPGVDVMVAQGGTEAIYQAMSTILKEGDEIVVSDPGWPHIVNFARSLGCDVISIPVYSANTHHKLLPELVEEKMTDKTRMIAVVDPLNPLGSSYTEQEIRQLCEIAERNDAYLLHDATYRDFAIDAHFPAVRYSERAVMNISLSKICGFAGLRVGATIAAPELMARIADHQVSRLGGNWIAQQGAIAAYRTKPNWCPKVLEANQRHQRMIMECVESIDGLSVIAYPSAGNFIAIDVTNGGFNSEAVVKAVLDEGVVIRSGGYTSDAFGSRFVRATTTVSEDHVRRFCTVLPKAIASLRK